MSKNTDSVGTQKGKNERRRYDRGFMEDNLKFTLGLLQLKRTRIQEKPQGKPRLAILWCNCCFSWVCALIAKQGHCCSCSRWLTTSAWDDSLSILQISLAVFLCLLITSHLDCWASLSARAKVHSPYWKSN